MFKSGRLAEQPEGTPQCSLVQVKPSEGLFFYSTTGGEYPGNCFQWLWSLAMTLEVPKVLVLLKLPPPGQWAVEFLWCLPPWNDNLFLWRPHGSVESPREWKESSRSLAHQVVCLGAGQGRAESWLPRLYKTFVSHRWQIGNTLIRL